MELLYHLSMPVLIVLVNHCLGEKTFEVTIVGKPKPGSTLIDLAQMDNTVQKCTIQEELKMYFICNNAKVMCIQELEDGIRDFTLKVKLSTDKEPENGTIHVQVKETAVYTIKFADVMAIPEEMKPGTEVNKLFSVTGVKDTDKLNYALQGEDSRYLIIDAETGRLNSGVPLDRDGENGRRYLNRLTIIVIINDVKSLSKPVNISVIDINDNAPNYIKSEWSVEAPENSTKNTIATLLCTDLDEGTNAKIVQTIVSPANSPFSMSGNALIADVLDYEDVGYVNKTYILTVKAVDQPTNGVALSSNTTVMVKVLPVNEFFPVWTGPFTGGNGATYKHAVDNNISAGKRLFTLTATDKDSGVDGELIYGESRTLNENGSETEFIFHVKESGAVHAIIDIAAPSVYKLDVFVSDKGKPRQSINATITIDVQKYETQTPENIQPSARGLRWAQKNTDGNIVLDLPKDSNVGTILATVKADGVEGTVTYEITGVELDGKPTQEQFLFLMQNGKLMALKTNDDYKEKAKHYIKVTVVATSGKGATKQRIECTVTINLVTISVPANHPPKWVVPFSGDDGAAGTVDVAETMEPGSTVTLVKATDQDSGPAGKVTYRISSIINDKGADAMNQFSFDPNTGILTTMSDLDLEDGAKSFKIILNAIDEGNPQQKIRGLLTITITDVNEYPPALDQSFYTATVNCEKQEGDDILRIKMSDKDATSKFKLTSSKKSDYVKIETVGHDTAAVFLESRPSHALYKEDHFQEFFPLLLSDGGVPEPKTSTGYMIIKYTKCNAEIRTKAPLQPMPEVTTSKPTEPPPKDHSVGGGEGNPQPTTKDNGNGESSEPTTESVTTEDGEVTGSTLTLPDDGTAASESPPWFVPSSHPSDITPRTTTDDSHDKGNKTNTNQGESGGSRVGGRGRHESAEWVVRSLCIVLFLGYVALGGIYIAKKYSLINLNCSRPKTAVHPRDDHGDGHDNNDNGPGGSVVDYGERQADNMPDITAALAIASPNYMDSYPRELPQPPTVTTTPAITPVPPSPSVPSVPLPPIPTIQTQPPPAVPPLSTTTSQMPPRFLPPLPEVTRRQPET